MPSPKYTDADLPRFNQKLGIQFVDESNDEPAPYVPEGPSADELLNDAKRTLAHANRLGAENNTSSLANLQTRLASLSQGPRPSISGAISSVTKPMHTAGSAMFGAALPALGMSYIPGAPALAGGLAAAGTMLSAPDVLRRLISPDEADPTMAAAPFEDESRGGAALEAGMLAAPQLWQGAKAGVGALRNASQARTVSKFRNAMRGGDPIPNPNPNPSAPTKFSLGHESPYQNTEPVNTARSMSRRYAPQEPTDGIIDGEIIPDELAAQLGGAPSRAALPPGGEPAGFLPESTQLRQPPSSLRQALGLPEATQIRLQPSSLPEPPAPYQPKMPEWPAKSWPRAERAPRMPPPARPDTRSTNATGGQRSLMERLSPNATARREARMATRAQAPDPVDPFVSEAVAPAPKAAAAPRAAERRMTPRLPEEEMPGVRNVLDEVIAPSPNNGRIQQLTSQFDDALANLPEEDFMSSLPDVPEPTFVDYEGSALAPFVANGSGESSASVEALNRLRSMASKNEKFAVRKRGATRDLIGPDAVDYSPGTDEEFGIIRDGLFQVLSRGARR